MGIFSVRAFSNPGATGAVVNTGNGAEAQPAQGQVQNVKVTMSSGEYILAPSTLQKNIPARLEFDLSTVTGCYRSVVISAFGVRKGLKQGDNIVEFTPTKAGTFGITCSMGMGRGTFKVLDSSGTPSAYVDTSAQQKAAGGSCGSSGGGCGCGG